MADREVGVPSGWSETELAALGGIVFNFTGLVFCVDQLLVGFGSAEDDALVKVARMGMAEKLKALREKAEAELDADEGRESLIGWVAGVELVTEERNGMIHSVWEKAPAPGVMTRIWPRVRGGVWDGVKTEVDLSRLNELADRIREGTEAAVRLAGMLAGSPRWYGRNLELDPI